MGFVKEASWIKIHDVMDTVNEAMLSWTDIEVMNETQRR